MTMATRFLLLKIEATTDPLADAVITDILGECEVMQMGPEDDISVKIDKVSIV